MRINTFFYSIRQGLKNIFRNKMFSLASVATMAACIFMFGLFYIIVTNFSATVHSIEEGVSVTVFFEHDATDAQIRDIGEKINKRAEVSKNEYVSADEAWKEYKKVYFQGKEELADGFTDNPLANSAHYQVYLNDVSMQDSLVTYIKGLTGVREVKESAQVANTLTDFNKLLGYVSGGIILILLCVAVFLISNTVMVGISVRKEEIAIMKLIGATDFLVRAPFIVEGIVISTIRTTIPATAPIRTFLGSCMILFIMSFTCFGILSLDNIFSTFISEKFIFVFFSGVSNGLPHLQQNFAPSTFSAPHFLQFIFLSCASQTYKRIHIRCLTD